MRGQNLRKNYVLIYMVEHEMSKEVKVIRRLVSFVEDGEVQRLAGLNEETKLG